MFNVSIRSGASQPRALQYILAMQLFSPCLAAAVPYRQGAGLPAPSLFILTLWAPLPVCAATIRPACSPASRKPLPTIPADSRSHAPRSQPPLSPASRANRTDLCSAIQPELSPRPSPSPGSGSTPRHWTAWPRPPPPSGFRQAAPPRSIGPHRIFGYANQRRRFRLPVVSNPLHYRPLFRTPPFRGHTQLASSVHTVPPPSIPEVIGVPAHHVQPRRHWTLHRVARRIVSHGGI